MNGRYFHSLGRYSEGGREGGKEGRREGGREGGRARLTVEVLPFVEQSFSLLDSFFSQGMVGGEGGLEGCREGGREGGRVREGKTGWDGRKGGKEEGGKEEREEGREGGREGRTGHIPEDGKVGIFLVATASGVPAEGGKKGGREGGKEGKRRSLTSNGANARTRRWRKTSWIYVREEERKGEREGRRERI